MQIYPDLEVDDESQQDPQMNEDPQLHEDPQMLEDLQMHEDPQMQEGFQMYEDPQMHEDLQMQDDPPMHLVSYHISDSSPTKTSIEPVTEPESRPSIDRKWLSEKLPAVDDQNISRKISTSHEEMRKALTPGALYQLMELHDDKQDLSFVEKVIFPRNQILNFSNAIAKKSARIVPNGERTFFDFELLNRRAIPIIGFYGHKALIIETFETRGIIEAQDQILAQMKQDKLSAGLYAFLQDTTLYVFYWYHGPKLPQASRKEISCNFVRCLVDLCDTVCVLMEAAEVKLFPSEVKTSRVSRSQRSREMKIVKQQATENSIKLAPGFCLPRLNVHMNGPSGSGMRATPLPPRFQLAAGVRCALIIPKVLPRRNPKRIWHKKELEVQMVSLPTLIKSWSEGMSLDFSRMHDGDFSIFLQTSGFPEGQIAIERLEKMEKTMSEAEDDLHNSLECQEDLENIEWQRCSDILKELLPNYVKLKYGSWELASSVEEMQRYIKESNLNPSKFGMKPQVDETLSRPVSLLTNINDFVKRGFQGSSRGVNNIYEQNQNKGAHLSFNDPCLNQLEEDLWKGSPRMLIFPGTQVRLECSRRQVNTGTFIVQRAQEHASPLSPLLCMEKVFLIPTNQRYLNKNIQWEVKFGQRGEQDFPLLTDDEVLIAESRGPGALFDKGDTIVLKLQPSYASGLQSWIGSMTETVIPQLAARAALFTAAVIKMKLYAMEDDPWDAEETRQILTAANPLGLDFLRNTLEYNGVWDEVQDKWREIQSRMLSPRGYADICNAISGKLKPKLVEVCKSVFGEKISELNREFLALAEKNTARLRKMKVQHEYLRRYEDLKEELSRELANFLKATKSQLSNKNQGVVGNYKQLFVQTCRLTSSTGAHILGGADGLVSVSRYISRSKFSPEDIFVSVESGTEEVIGAHYICYEAIEVAPMKPDSEKLRTDPDHAFTPVCSQVQTFMEIDQNVERLAKVVYLKSGELLIFLISLQGDVDKELNIYFIPKLGTVSKMWKLVRNLKRGFDLVAFDEKSKLLALYHKDNSIIKIFCFTNNFKQVDWSGLDVNLKELGNSTVVWMEFIADRKELVFVDEANRVRVFEIEAPHMIKPKEIDLGPLPFKKACVAGPCLLVFRKSTQVPQHGPDYDDDEGSKQTDNPLLGFFRRQGVEDVVKNKEDSCLTIDVYWVDDTMALVSTLTLNGIGTADVSKIEAHIVKFETQLHLVLHNRDNPTTLMSKVLNITSASDKYFLNKVVRPSSAPEENSSGSTLDYVYHIFDKYSTNPPLVTEQRHLVFRMFLKGSQGRADGDDCQKYFKSCLKRLETEKGKKFQSLYITSEINDFEDLDFDVSKAGTKIRMGNWIRRLLCLVPIQVARAENNGLKPLVDGLQLKNDVDYSDAVSLANVIRFGFYDAVLAQWTGSVKVISSMGKQSSGKSYLLNHLSGSLLDVSGGRCTDGVWMTVRIVEKDENQNGYDCLYVLLDFEGLGSFERSEQEDMLLSVLNAAISNITIFNKKDFHLDKETEAVFERFQNGVSLVRPDEKLFKGKFYMAIKDVDNSDVDDLQEEFENKIQQMLAKTSDNFLTKMYGGCVQIATMASFNKPEFYESIEDIAFAVQELEPSYKNGRSFSGDLKLVIAQLCAKDWSPIDSKRVVLKINLIRKHLTSAINLGSLLRTLCTDGETQLIQFDTQIPIADRSIQPSLSYAHDEFSIEDTGLELIPSENGNGSISDILMYLNETFQRSIARDGSNDEEWHSALGMFIIALADRRRDRVLQWISMNTEGLDESDGDLRKLSLETKASLAELKQGLSLCSSKCGICFLRCTKEKGHSFGHSCLGTGDGDHKCKKKCTFCIHTLGADTTRTCDDLAGHQGEAHDCKLENHTCMAACIHVNDSWNCNKTCSYKSGHTEPHKCNSKEHLCKHTCSLPDCGNLCVSPVAVDHQKHSCHEKVCPKKCPIGLCNRTCASQDHFHALDSTASHLCGSEHRCYEMCQSKGICEINTELVRVQRTFSGKRGSFNYDCVSEQNGKKKECAIVIPPFKMTHDGDHIHTTTVNAVHFCATKCPSCGYYCTQPIDHNGLHDTTHGNMRHAIFASEAEEIDIDGRKYIWGESGVAEMCNMHCKAQGRGHMHLQVCPGHAKFTGAGSHSVLQSFHRKSKSAATQSGKLDLIQHDPKSGRYNLMDQVPQAPTPGACLSLLVDGARHETQKYGPHFNIPKDELTHAAYWKHLNFVDPCSGGEQREFGLCSFQCMADSHKASSSNKVPDSKKQISYCTEKLWHKPLAISDLGKFSTGYITSDGHHMNCIHTSATGGGGDALHIIFIVDMSASMEAQDIVPQYAKFISSQNNRLGCVLEAIMHFCRTRQDLLKYAVEKDDVSVIRFGQDAQITVGQTPLEEGIVDRILKQVDTTGSWRGGTNYSSALQSAREVVKKSTKSSGGKQSVVIFFSDGDNNCGSDPLPLIQELKSLDPGLVLHTVVFGAGVGTTLLERMATAGGGKLHVSIDHLQLVRTFVSIAKKPVVTGLVNLGA